MTDPEVDPRFDPRYQRGGEDRRSSLSRPAPVGPPPPAVPASADALAPASADRIVVPPSIVPGAVVPAAARAGAGDLVDELDSVRGNPYRLALLILSLAAIVASVALFWIAATTRYGATTQNDATFYFTTAAANSLAPALLSGGAIALVLWVAVGAFLHHAEQGAPPAAADGPAHSAAPERDV